MHFFLYLKNNEFHFLSKTPKFTQYLKNLSAVLLKLNNDEALLKSVQTIKSLIEELTANEESVKELNETLTFILLHYQKLPSACDEMFEHILSCIVEDENSVNRHDYYKRYLKQLYKTEKINKLLCEAAKMHEIFNQDIYPLGNET